MLGAARTGSIVVYAAADSKALMTSADDGAKGYSCDD
jgi:hypothetical protein